MTIRTALFIATIVFVVLKALGYLTWPWWLVFLPAILYVAPMIVIIFLIGVMSLLRDHLKELKAKRDAEKMAEVEKMRAESEVVHHDV